jgi:hypothetical protein
MNPITSIKQYKTVSTPLVHELDAIVNDLIKDGFQPYGSPYSVCQDNTPVFCQAMVNTSTAKESKLKPAQPGESRVSLLLGSHPVQDPASP